MTMLRDHVDVLYNSVDDRQARRGRTTKTARLKAVAAIRVALQRKTVIAALSAASVQEMLRGPGSDADRPLAWAELSCIVLSILGIACEEARKSKSVSRANGVNMRRDYIDCFRSVLKLALKHGPPGVLRHLVRAFLDYAYSWLSEPAIRVGLADQIWQSIKDLLQDEDNRAMLLPPFIRKWVDACFEQLTGRGALTHPSQIVTSIAGDVLQLLATPCESYDTLTQSTRGVAGSKMLGGEFGYAVIAERCCMMLVVAENMSRRDAREIQEVSFKTLAIVLTDHALDILGSNGLNSIVNASLKPLITCWAEKKYQNSATTLAKLLLTVAGSNRELTTAVRHRILSDMKDESSSAVVRAGEDVSDSYIDSAANCFTLSESLQYAAEKSSLRGTIIIWLRVIYALVSRRVLQKEANVLVNLPDVILNFTSVAETVTVVLRRERNVRESAYNEIVRWSTSIINVVAPTANSIYLNLASSQGSQLTTAPWHALYQVLREHSIKAKYSAPTRGVDFRYKSRSVASDQVLVHTLALLCSLDVIDNETIEFSSETQNNRGLSLPYPLSRIADSAAAMPAAAEISYFRNLIARNGVLLDTGSHLRHQLLFSLLRVCRDLQAKVPLHVIQDSSAAALGITRGECTLREATMLSNSLEERASEATLVSLHTFLSWFGLRSCDSRIDGDGMGLVSKALDQDKLWRHQSGLRADETALSTVLVEQTNHSQSIRIPDRSASNLQRHVQVESNITDGLEAEMVRELKHILGGHTSLSPGEPDIEREANEGDEAFCEQLSELCNTGSGVLLAVRMACFVGNYLALGMKLGSFMPSDDNTSTAFGDIASLFAELMRCIGKAKMEDLVECAELTTECITSTATVYEHIDRGAESQPPIEKESVWRNLSQELLASLGNLSKRLSEFLMTKLLHQSQLNVKLVEQYATDLAFENFTARTKKPSNKRRAPGVATGRAGKKRRQNSPAQSLDSFGSGYDERPASRPADDQGSLSDENDLSDDSDDMEGHNDTSNTHVKPVFDTPNNGTGNTAIWQNLSSALRICSNRIPLMNEVILDVILKGLRAVDETERISSPDSFERAALTSHLVDSSFLEGRKAMWDILTAVGSDISLTAVSSDISIVGQMWKQLESKAHDYVAVYVEELSRGGQKKQYPVPRVLEEVRTCFLRYARFSFEKTTELTFSKRRALMGEGGGLVNNLIEITEISDYFKARHAFRMPRVVRVAYLQFGTSAVQLSNALIELSNAQGGESAHARKLADAVKEISAVVPKFLGDSECIVRLLAASSLAKPLLACTGNTLAQMESTLRENLPTLDSCDDNSSFLGGGIIDDVRSEDEDVYITWELSESEQSSFLAIHKSFRKIGASSKGYSSLLLLGQMAGASADLLPFCLAELIDRVADNPRFTSCCYQVLVRLSTKLGCDSPRTLYSLFSRLLLPKWFARKGAISRLYDFPAILFVDSDHYRDNVLYDWMRDQQGPIISHLLVREKSLSLELVSRFANVLEEELCSLLSENVAAFSLLFPMQFIGGSHQRGQALWKAVDTCLNGKAMKLMSQQKSEVIAALLRSVSANAQGGTLFSAEARTRESELGFCRDTRTLKPPLYDPLVIALTINHLYASKSSLSILPKPGFQGSLFAEVRDIQTASVFAQEFKAFAKESRRRNASLLRVFFYILRFYAGPPSPQPPHSRLDAFFCVGMLWRMLGNNILVQSRTERVAFYDLIARGFEHQETAPDASWLLLDVQKKVSSLHLRHEDVETESSTLSQGHVVTEVQLLSSVQERQMFELLNSLSPVLASVIVKDQNTTSSSLRVISSGALKHLLALCSEASLWNVILANGPFPSHKTFKEVRMLYEKSKKLADSNTACTRLDSVLQSASRFQGIYNRPKSPGRSLTLLASLQELHKLMNEEAILKMSLAISSEAWMRSADMPQSLKPLIEGFLSCVIDLMHESFADIQTPRHRVGSIVPSGKSTNILIIRATVQEIANIISVLGLLHPQSGSQMHLGRRVRVIPPYGRSLGYEDVGSAIILSLQLLQSNLCSSSALQSEIALDSLTAVLRSLDGKKVFEKNRMLFPGLRCFETLEKSSQDYEQELLALRDPHNGHVVFDSELPDIHASETWGFHSHAKEMSESHAWIRRLCSSLAKNCKSPSLKSLAAVCYASSQFSCEMLPYLLMDTICDLGNKCSSFSAVLRNNVFTNQNIPTSLLRTFVHALDVLCQIGFDVLASKGLSAWLASSAKPHLVLQLYVLEIPYLDAARAALRSGCYFSVLRFVQLYIDQKIAKVELKLSSKRSGGRSSRSRHSTCHIRDPLIEVAEKDARERARNLIQDALTGISEPDSLRAFTQDRNLAKSAASIAHLDGDWTTSLAAFEVFSRDLGATPEENHMEPNYEFAQNSNRKKTIDFNRELGVMQSFIGLGTLNVAVDYWNGLRSRVLKYGCQEETLRSLDYQKTIRQLNDLRYAAAWKLEHWETPLVLASTGKQGVSITRGEHGFHKAVYRTLRSFTTGRFGDVPRILSDARVEELKILHDGVGAVPTKNLFETAARLRVLYTLSCAHIQKTKPGEDVRRVAAVNIAESKQTDSASYPFRLNGSSVGDDPGNWEGTFGTFSESTHPNDLDGDVVQQIMAGFYGVEDKNFREGLILSRDAFAESVAAEDLPVVLARCLDRKADVARISATLSARILEKGSSGAWARSASCLGNPSLSFLDDAAEQDRIAWRMQEARLKWSISNDAPSKKQALNIVKDIISHGLGGAVRARGSSSSSEGSAQQYLEWQSGEASSELLAFLRSEACCMAAKWSHDMRTHEPMDLFQMYLDCGLKAVKELSGETNLNSRAHFAMATFADGQITNIDLYRKTRSYEEMVKAVRDLEENIESLKSMKAESASRTRSTSSRRASGSSRSALASGANTAKNISRDLGHLIDSTARKARQDRAKLEKLNENYRKWQVLACKHFAACLRNGNTYDLRAAFRMVALWLDSGPMREHITRVLTNRGKIKDGHSQSVHVPVSKLLPLAPQLASRLNHSENIGDNGFQSVLSHTITKMAAAFPAYCLWQLIALANAMKDCGNSEKYSTLYRGDKDKKDSADEILERLEQQHGEKVREMKMIADAYIKLSETEAKKKAGQALEIGRCDLIRLGELKHVPVPTIPLPPSGSEYNQHIPHVYSFGKRAGICSGLSRPLRIVCVGSDGKKYPQMVKGRDDLRGDAVMEQLFSIVNTLLEKDGDAARRSLHIRTYRIIPLSPFSGIMQFVSNTKQMKEVLAEKDEATKYGGERLSLHERYRPQDMKPQALMNKAFDILRNRESGGPRKVISFLAEIWQNFQPVFRYFFLEQWPDPGEWFSHQLSYSRSVAVMCIVGFILGLGDRHLSNILLDVYSGEIVHIDFGIAFELGKLLPTPEHMPFRLTRDLVDGFGIAGVEGVFRRCSEITLSVMRRSKDLLLTVVEVLLHDPMYSWALAPEEVLKEQLGNQRHEEYCDSAEMSKSSGDSIVDAAARKLKEKMEGSRDAKRALHRIREKLDGLEGAEMLTVESHVARLVDEAQAFHVIACVYPGWCPWL